MRKIENKPELSTPKKHFYSHKIELKIGEWRKHFDFNYASAIIAMALNHCTKDKDFFINGYLITNQSLYLVAKTDKKEINSFLIKLEQYINHSLQIHFQKQHSNNYCKNQNIEDNENIYYLIHKPLFELSPLKNNCLIKLITGKKVVLPYFDRKLENLKFIIKNHPFCSSIDYSGAVGPVLVTLLEG